MDNVRICRRCLIRDFSEADELRSIERLIESVPAEERTSEKIYNARLEACRQCDHLVRGTCMKCGCYVEVRAAGRNGGCPDTPDRWQIQEKQ